MSWNRKVPFDNNGKMMDYVYFGYEAYEWVDANEFTDELEYVDHGRGRSALRIRFKSMSTGKTYVFAEKSLDEIMRHICGGRIYGRFGFVKRGENYQTVIVALGHMGQVGE